MAKLIVAARRTYLAPLATTLLRNKNNDSEDGNIDDVELRYRISYQ